MYMVEIVPSPHFYLKVLSLGQLLGVGRQAEHTLQGWEGAEEPLSTHN